MKGEKMKTNKNGNMYDFAQAWNCLHGECEYGCSYCSTQTLKRFPVMAKCYSGEPRLNEVAMKENLYSKKYKDKLIFVAGQNDLFAPNVEWEIIDEVLEYCRKFPKAKFLFQSKNPGRFDNFIHRIPKGSILCTTIESNWDFKTSKAPHPCQRASDFGEINGFEKHLTCEPIMKFDIQAFAPIIMWTGATSINIGADSKRHKLPEPTKPEVLALIAALEDLGINVHLKSNLNRLLKQ
jgi:DNA repair photolyase